MSSYTANATVHVLTTLLDEERQALRDGDLIRVQNMIPEKERLLTYITQLRLPVTTLQLLQDAVERNARLMEATARGIRAALQRIKTLRNGPAPLQTYGPAGQITMLQSRRQGRVHKA